MTCGIYEIVNTVNGKRYVGSSININGRWLTHIRELRKGTHHAQHLQRSFDKYGEECFQVRTILVCDRVDLIENEQIEIDKGYDYNSSPTAQSTLGLKLTDEQRAKSSAAKKLLYETDEAYRTHVNTMSAGKPKSDSWKRQMSDRLLGTTHTASHVENMAKSRAEISKDKVIEIIELRASGLGLTDISEIVDVSWSQVQKICSGKSYKWASNDCDALDNIDSSQIRMKLVKRPFNKTIFTFIHPEHGERICTQWDLKNEFPDIKSSKLSLICSEYRKMHAGWTLKKPPD